MVVASSKVSGLDIAVDDDDVHAVKTTTKQLGSRWTFARAFVALSVVAVVCTLLYAPRLGPRIEQQRGAAAAFLGLRVGRSGVADGDEGGIGPVVLDNQVGSPCSTMPENSICCDRSDYHSDVCFMSGDVRTDAKSLSLLLFPPPGGAATTTAAKEERIRPYTRKWDAFVTKDIHEVRLRAARPEESASPSSHRCDVRHDAPALVVTAGGYSHNMFHVFNDGFLPAWLTAQHLRRRVVVLALAYTPSWAGRFGEMLAALSRYHVVDLLRDTRTHCFPGAIVGTRYHDYLAVDPARLRDNKTAVDFHKFLAAAYDDEPRHDETAPRQQPRRLRLGIVSRKGRRVIENQAAVADVAASVGFDVSVMETGRGRTPPLAATYAAVNAYDALVGVHGADLTAFLFLRPGTAALVQVAPLGIKLLSRNLFGVPAARMGLHYEQYDLRLNESSLSRKYAPDDVVVADPGRARLERGKKAWDLVEYVYLRGQNVSLDLGRFRETLTRRKSEVVHLVKADCDNISMD
ncbi:hypothetical protein EJB05_56541, partial [Eragrostis curvula]